MARTRRPRRSMNQINVVPYIDVMLVLLVIFMVATPMMQAPGVVNLPTVGKSDQEASVEPLRVEIGVEGELTLSDAGKSETVADAQALVALVQDKLAAKADRPVVIAGDKSVRYETVMATMDALKAANVARVGLLVRPK
ncbi:protein TolR [Jeongeupia sp. USM3]|nr:protein TolR [Jeongeupia sp. USM3]